MTHFHQNPGPSRTLRGFSLIEVMVAVVILATGLLALAVLQGTLARNSADAKARSAVMAAMTSRMAVIRRAPPTSGSTWAMSTDWVSQAAAQAGTSDLQVVEAIGAWSWNSASTGATFVNTAVASPASTFTRATLTATWTAADGTKSLKLSSDFSGNIYGLGKGYPGNDPLGSAAKYPIVRQDNPSNTAGVIPIVTGNQATAASNPQPIIKGANNNLRVGTSFDVLSYVPEGATAKITKRFETQVIKCRCRFASPDYSVEGAPQWPAVWDGNTYTTYASSSGSPAGVSANAGEDEFFSGSDKGNSNGVKSARLQSETCTECCRDHHDSSASPAEARFDPEATAVGKYDVTNGVVGTSAVNSGTYVAACRVVRAGGLWKTTADMYERQYGLLETTAVGGVQAKSGIPDNSTGGSVQKYQTFVKDYLAQYTATVTPSNAPAMFDDLARGLNAPATITIAAASTSDNRYLHGRGLFVDYLGAKAKEAINNAISSCGASPTSAQLAECILPILPFTTINLTEMAKWTATDPTVLDINTFKSLSYNVEQPFGGRTRGVSVGVESNLSDTRLSNSGVAVSDSIPGAVDRNGDFSAFTDSQVFAVGAGSSSTGGTGDAFWISVSGAILGTNPAWALPSLGDFGNCSYNATLWVCTTNSTLPNAGVISLRKYNQELPISFTFNPEVTAGCTRVGKETGGITKPDVTMNRAQYVDYYVSSISNAGTATISDPPQNAGTFNESTLVDLSAIPKGSSTSTVNVEFKQNSTALATITACTYYKSGSIAKIESITWNKTWCPTTTGNPTFGCL